YHEANGAPPGGIILDNQDGGVTFTGTWPVSTSVSGYYEANYQHHPAGSGSNSVTWTPEIADAGDYEVYIRWTTHPNRASNAKYTINYDGGSETITVNQRENGGTWNHLGTFSFAVGTSGNIVLTDEADGYVIADSVKLVPVNAEPNTAIWTPDISEAGNYKVYARWTAHSNRASNTTYTIHHNGGTTSVVVNQQENGGTWNYLGTFAFLSGTSGKITLTDEADGYVIADAVKLVPENGTEHNSVTWRTDIPEAGNYKVYARWTAHPNRATDAKYSINYDGGSETVVVNQQENGGEWNLLGTFYFAADNSGSITLTDEANGYVIADAVMLRRVYQEGGAEKISVYFYHNDHLGTPQVMTDESGTVAWRADYMPFGHADVIVGAIDNNFRLPGQYYDQETGLHYNYHRYYDPRTGRYLRVDPSHYLQANEDVIPYLLPRLLNTPQALNLYVYCKNNPINREDPFGLCEEKECNTPWHVCVPRCRNYFSVAPDGAPPSPPSIIYDGAVSYFCMAICGINPCSFDDPKYDEPFWW
ncbi:RHS domain-containing protein, partial [bacterium]|nr:RHS domain-containing protein [bacterium]